MASRKSRTEKRQRAKGRRSTGLNPMIKVWGIVISIVISLVLLIIFIDEYQINQGFPSLIKKRQYDPYIPQRGTEATPDTNKHQVRASQIEQGQTDSPRNSPSQKPNMCGAIIIDDLGLDWAIAQECISLDLPIACSILPNMPYSTKIAERAHQNGKIVMAHIPMETIDETKMKQSLPWLLVGMSLSTIETTIDTIIAEIHHAQGANNHTGSRFTADRTGMKDVLSCLKKRGMFFIDSRTTTETLAFQIAQSMGIPSAERQVFFDNMDDDDKIRDEFERFIQLIIRDKSAIAIGHTKPKTLALLKEYGPIFKQKGITIVPVTSLLSPPYSTDQLARKR
ncbi:divergent polysaccharide deacetylase family protein [bacterium]|nr:divergent polysaccharide deacetylase family protein [bacterium]